jgi:Mycothiol maleylpyruvate isomerase N-terminal domain
VRELGKNEIIAAVDDSWRSFRDSFERLTTTDLDVPGVTGEWSIKDLVGHVAAWDVALARLVAARDAGPGLNDREVAALNRQQTSRRGKKPLAEVLTELEEARRTLREALQGAPDAIFEPGDPLRERIDTYSVFHHQEHAAEIKLWIDSTRRGWRPGGAAPV